MSVLSESISKSTCALPMMSNAVRVWASWAVSRTFWASSRPISPRSLADPFEPAADLRASASPARAPTSRARVHSLMREWCHPSRRSTADFSPCGAAAYSPTTASLYAAANERLVGRGAGSGAICWGIGAVSGTASPVSSADELLLITFSFQSCPTSQTPKPGVPHVRLTERAWIFIIPVLSIVWARRKEHLADDAEYYHQAALNRRREQQTRAAEMSEPEDES